MRLLFRRVQIGEVMRSIFISGLAVFISVSAALADPTDGLNRRQFVLSASACLLSTLGSSDTSPITHYRHWSMHPGLDIETLGLESFGSSVKELLEKEGYVADRKTLERIRWDLQERLWEHLEPKSEIFRSFQIRTTVAVRVRNDLYVYLRPNFRVEALGPKDSAHALQNGRTIGRIEFVADTRDTRTFTYWTGKAPADPTIISIQGVPEIPESPERN